MRMTIFIPLFLFNHERLIERLKRSFVVIVVIFLIEAILFCSAIEDDKEYPTSSNPSYNDNEFRLKLYYGQYYVVSKQAGHYYDGYCEKPGRDFEKMYLHTEMDFLVYKQAECKYDNDYTVFYPIDKAQDLFFNETFQTSEHYR